MPVTPDKPGPYAPAKVIIGVVDRYRERGLPSPVDIGVLTRAGVPESLAPRTIQALQHLDLLTPELQPTDVLERLRRAPEAEYKQRFREWLEGAYADALQFVDPATATETQVRDAFRNYKPYGQHTRIVSLFIGLFTEAGVMPLRQAAPRAASTATPRPRRLAHRTPSKAREDKKSLIGGAHSQMLGLPPALAGLLQSLPANGQSWTQDARDKFYKTFGAVLDFCFTIGEQPDNEFDALMGEQEHGD